MPYLSDVGISRKSPYSSSANPELHNWINMVCAFNESVRSINARMNNENNVVNILANAIIMANAMGTNYRMSLQHISDKASAMHSAKTNLVLARQKGAQGAPDGNESDNELTD
jgi:hypothetical protein